MKLSLSIESANHHSNASPPNRERGWRLVVEEWRQARSTGQSERASQAETALAVFVALTGEDESLRRHELGPLKTTSVESTRPSSPSPLPTFREGRSVPPPPPHPGAQRPVQDSGNDHQ